MASRSSPFNVRTVLDELEGREFEDPVTTSVRCRCQLVSPSFRYRSCSSADNSVDRRELSREGAGRDCVGVEGREGNGSEDGEYVVSKGEGACLEAIRGGLVDEVCHGER